METSSEQIIDIVSKNNSVIASNELVSEITTSMHNCENNDISPLSKKQLRKKRKKEKWLANLPAKRAKEKMKLKQKRLEARANNLTLGPSRKSLKASKMSTSKCKVRVAIDMSFDHLMNDKDIAKCTKQLLRCYSSNRRAAEPMQLYVTSFGGKTENEMQKHTGFRNWDINFCSESVFDVFKPDELVYLSSDSENVVTQLDESKVYIIGGLVDHNAQKGHCYELAKTKGIGHAQLPIGEFLEMKTRTVLAVNHVYEILVAVSGGDSWQEAFMRTLPLRKGATVKSEASSEEFAEDIKEATIKSEANSGELAEDIKGTTVKFEANSEEFAREIKVEDEEPVEDPC